MERSFEIPAEDPFLELQKKESLTAIESYHLSHSHLWEGNFEGAKKSLLEALEKKPDFQEALVQLGFIYLWEDLPLQALDFFELALSYKPCNSPAIEGVFQVARQLPDPQALLLFEQIISCQPDHVDTLFLQALIYRKLKEPAKAIALLEKVLAKEPTYEDALAPLASLYLELKCAEALSWLYQEYPHHLEIIRAYANFLFSQERFTQATCLFEKLPANPQLWRTLWESKARSNHTLIVDSTYTQARETDPSIGQPTVKDFYSLTNIKAWIPLSDKWRLDARALFYNQREQDIYPPIGLNYDMYEAGAEVIAHYYFIPTFRFDAIARLFRAWGAQEAIFPFQNTLRFEPGVQIVSLSQHLLVLDAHIESFVIKNFSADYSQLLRTSFFQGAYGYRWDGPLHPRIEAWVGGILYQDNLHNVKNQQAVMAQVDLLFPCLTTLYKYEHGHFKYLNENYFSYKQQDRNTLQLAYKYALNNLIDVSASWDHTWEMTRNLLLPIGDFVYEAPSLYLIWNTYTVNLNIQNRDRLRIELSGHYLYNTLPYWDWNIKGAFIWRF